MVTDDLRIIALCQDTNQPGATELLAMSDEDYAMELQLQEVIVSSTMAATAVQSSCTPQPESFVPAAISDGGAVEMPVHAVAECSYSSSPLLASPAASEGAVTAIICKICLDYMSPSDLHRASGACTHSFCTACLTRYISAKIQDSNSDVKCPAEDCDIVLDPELFQDMLSKEAFEAWGAALCRSTVLGASNVCYCPFNDCSEIMVDERGDGVPESECPVCRRLFCAQCGVPWHAGISCAEYEQLAPGDRGKDDMVVLEMAKGKKWRRCPRCKFLVEKHDGCVHITCRCRFEFCYGCGEQWTQSEHSSCHAT